MDKKQIKLNRFIEKIRIKLDTEKWYLWIDEENRAIGEAEAGALFQLVKIKILGFYWGNKEKHAVLYTPALGQTQHLEFSNTIFFLKPAWFITLLPLITLFFTMRWKKYQGVILEIKGQKTNNVRENKHGYQPYDEVKSVSTFKFPNWFQASSLLTQKKLSLKGIFIIILNMRPMLDNKWIWWIYI